MTTPAISSSPIKRRLLILIFVLALVIIALVAVLIWWPKSDDKKSADAPEPVSAEASSVLPEALQPMEEADIDNSDLLASADENIPSDPAQPVNRLTLMIRNRSVSVDPVDLIVTLDDRVIVDENFKYGSSIEVGAGIDVPAPGLDWKQLPLKLPAGSHQIKVESAKGGAAWNTDFTTTDKEWWASLEYLDGRKFDWKLSDLPIAPL